MSAIRELIRAAEEAGGSEMPASDFQPPCDYWLPRAEAARVEMRKLAKLAAAPVRKEVKRLRAKLAERNRRDEQLLTVVEGMHCAAKDYSEDDPHIPEECPICALERWVKDGAG